MKFMAWPEIEGFHNIRKFIRVDPGEWWHKKELLAGTSIVSYKAKVKLHGTNAAVQIHKDGTVIAQSRTNIITPENDNAGFARWVKTNEVAWQKHCSELLRADVGWIIYGEWIGPGIQKGVAVSEIPKKCFAVFAARPIGDSDVLLVEPDKLRYLTVDVPDTYVLPWYEQSIDIDWKQTDEELTKAIAPINDWVMAIEANDPWVEKTFGVKGTGEGLVFYPTSSSHIGFEDFTNLCFKAKGEAHKNIKTAAPVQVNPEVAASVEAFAELALTHARLEQGATKVALTPGIYDAKQTGKFVQWIETDVEKETQDELATSNLTWPQVQKVVQSKARQWYLTQSKKF